MNQETMSVSPQVTTEGWLNNLNPDQRKQWLDLTQRIEALAALAGRIPILSDAERQDVNVALNHARDRLRLDQNYNISVIGFTGTGKSTLINALLGRRLVVFKFGRSTTGTVVTVRQNAEEGKEQIVIRYHTPETLKQVVENLCQKLNQTPVYTDKTRQYIDVSKILELARSQWTNYAALANSPLEEPEYRALLDSVEDLLATAERHEERLSSGENEEILAMNEANVQQVQAMTDEKSALNAKGSETRIIPLIRDVEYQIAPADVLPHANLIDFPGPGALTSRHEEYLREQLDPTKTTAIILVMAPRRAEAGTQEPLRRISDVLLRGLDENTRRLVAKRIFLVVSQRDASTGTDPAVVEREVHDNVRKVAGAITTDFFDRYERSNVFLNVMALPALISQLLDEHPAEAESWQEGEAVAGAFEDIDYEHYQTIVERAKKETRIADNEDAVLELSQIPDLRAALNTFASRSRWELDLREALGHYKRAYTLIADAINSRWTKSTGARPLSGEDAQTLLNRLRRDQKLIYSEQIQQDVRKVMQYFTQAHETLESRGIEHLLRAKLNKVVEQIGESIQEHTSTDEFQTGLTSQAVDLIYRETYVTSALPAPLIELNRLVLEWFDTYSGTVADEMVRAFQAQLDAEGVASYLESVCQGWPDTESYLKIYREEIIAWLREQYRYACRGYVLSEVLQENVTRKIKAEVEGQPQPQPVASADEDEEEDPTAQATGSTSSSAWWMTHKTQAELEAEAQNAAAQSGAQKPAPQKVSTASQPERDAVVVIRQQYAKAHKQLAQKMDTQLARLFRYHLAVAKAKLERVVDDLGLALSVEVSTPGSVLYAQMQDTYGGYLSTAEELVGYWQQLRPLSL